MADETTTLLLGNVLSMTNGLASEPAVAFRGDRIVGTGDQTRLADRAADPRILDFGQRTILPGFIDTHAHAALTSIGAETMVDCVNGVSSLEDMLQALVDNLAASEETGWLMARGMLGFRERWRADRNPTREDLDRVSTEIPIAVRTGHLSILNTRALEVVEIGKYFDVKQGSLGPISISFGDDGQPNGLVSNLDALLPFPAPGADVVKAALESGIRRLFTANGVTSICEMSDTLDSLRAMVELIDAARIGPRFSVFVMAPATLPLDQAVAWRENGITDRPGMLDVRGIKMFADGGYSSSDAAVNVPYTDAVALEPGSKGKLSFTDDELKDVLRTVAAAGLQLALHTNGERCQEQVCRVVEELGLTDAQPVRLEHAGNWVFDARTPDAWRLAGAVPASQPAFLFTMGPSMPLYLGAYGAQHGRGPYRTLLETGWDMPSGSDCYWSYEDDVTDPTFGMWCTMVREGWDGEVMDPEEAIDLESALRMQTVNGAKAMGEASTRGTLEEGKLADVVVLDRDITQGVTGANIREVDVDYVFRGGELIHIRDGAAPYVAS
jgi:predicted amidohydrolase YtcJ